MSVLALFDLDHTLLRTNSSYRFGVYLYSKKIFSFPTLSYLLGCYGCHKIFGMSLKSLHEKVFERLFRGRLFATFDELAREFVSKTCASMLYSPAVWRLRQIQLSGGHAVLLSNAPDFLVRYYAEYLAVDEWKATIYRVDGEGRLSHVGALMAGSQKADYGKKLALRLGLSQEGVQAFSDSSLDLPLLEWAGKPVAVNPDRKLLRLSRRRGWEVI